jgi:hypothetical protein
MEVDNGETESEVLDSEYISKVRTILCDPQIYVVRTCNEENNMKFERNIYVFHLFFSQLIGGSEDTFDYYGESDLEIEEDSMSVNKSEVCVHLLFLIIM